MKRSRLSNLIGVLFLLSILSACGSGGSSSSATGTGTGTLSTSLTDSTTADYKAVYVTVLEVQVHRNTNSGKKWQVVASPEETYNLLELVNGVREHLGLADLPQGHYTQMRLLLGPDPLPAAGINILSEPHPYPHYFIDHSDNYHELKVPSGYQTGIKMVSGFEINANQTTEVTLDFDALESIVQAGSSGQCLLKPVIRVLDDLQDYSIVSGIVETRGATITGLEGVLVSAQVHNPDATDPKDEVIVRARTVTDESGHYKLFVRPGNYHIVAYLDGYGPSCEMIDAESDNTYTQDFTLDTVTQGYVSGDVVITGGGPDQHVTISFRRSAPCDATAQIEVKSVNVLTGGNYNESLPLERYTAVISTYDFDTQVENDVDAVVAPGTQVDIVF
jgi:hypothetical protein